MDLRVRGRRDARRRHTGAGGISGVTRPAVSTLGLVALVLIALWLLVVTTVVPSIGPQLPYPVTSWLVSTRGG
jgi:hypothetical protein